MTWCIRLVHHCHASAKVITEATQFTPNFTRGDIIVDVGKLGFFRKKHFRRMLLESPPNAVFLDECLIRPVLERVRDVEARKGMTVGAHAADAFLASIDSLTPPMWDLESGPARNHIHEATKISRDVAYTPDEIVGAIRYLLWRPSQAQLRKTLVAASGLAATATVGGNPATPLDVVALFVETLGQLSDDEWNRPRLDPAITAAAQAVQSQRQGIGHRLLRCALLGSESGPQIVPLLQLLGRQETMVRLKAAREVLTCLYDKGPSGQPGECS